jgi:hypothetical protein
LLGHDHESGTDLLRGWLAIQGGDCLVDTVGSDHAGLLRDQRLNHAAAQVLHLLRARVEAHDLHHAKLASLPEAVAEPSAENRLVAKMPLRSG